MLSCLLDRNGRWAAAAAAALAVCSGDGAPGVGVGASWDTDLRGPLFGVAVLGTACRCLGFRGDECLIDRDDSSRHFKQTDFANAARKHAVV